ncbi:MAG TPA: hypothetical protein VK141_03615 [Nitrosomonas sp.]|nr:hypothetical protein [Nitrosomonas sp.]
MKKILLALGIAWLAFSSCSKEEEPITYVTTFYFKLRYGSREIVEYGNYYRYSSGYGGPAGRYVVQNDSTILTVRPDYNPGGYDLMGYITFSKKGTDLVGEYTVRGQLPAEFMIHTEASGVLDIAELKTVPGSERLTITKTGDSKDGKYAEGTMSFNTYSAFDTIPVPASASFRLKMD